jgi:hypothetical protein
MVALFRFDFKCLKQEALGLLPDRRAAKRAGAMQSIAAAAAACTASCAPAAPARRESPKIAESPLPNLPTLSGPLRSAGFSWPQMSWRALPLQRPLLLLALASLLPVCLHSAPAAHENDIAPDHM